MNAKAIISKIEQKDVSVFGDLHNFLGGDIGFVAGNGESVFYKREFRLFNRRAVINLFDELSKLDNWEWFFTNPDEIKNPFTDHWVIQFPYKGKYHSTVNECAIINHRQDRVLEVGFPKSDEEMAAAMHANRNIPSN